MVGVRRGRPRGLLLDVFAVIEAIVEARLRRGLTSVLRSRARWNLKSGASAHVERAVRHGVPAVAVVFEDARGETCRGWNRAPAADPFLGGASAAQAAAAARDAGGDRRRGALAAVLGASIRRRNVAAPVAGLATR